VEVVKKMRNCPQSWISFSLCGQFFAVNDSSLSKKKHDSQTKEIMLFPFPDKKGMHSENLIVFSITQTVLSDDYSFTSRQCSLIGLTQLTVPVMQSQNGWYAICLFEVSLQVALPQKT